MAQVTPNNYIGSNIDSTVTNQLKKRSELLSSASRNLDWQRVNTSKTAWVKVSSSIDVGAEGNVPAIAYKLHATGIRGDSDLNPGYDLERDGLGIRPIPGITNVNISALNRFGTLRTATVEFKAYTVDQLDYLEQLYMRPGFSILLEWGHSVYIDNQGEVVSKPKTIGDRYFSQGAFNKVSIQKEIQSLRKGNSHNYDAMFGYVKNFSWSYNMDGSYNCTVDIVSIGEILESLKFLIPGEKTDATEEDEAKSATALHELIITASTLATEEFADFDPVVKVFEKYVSDVGQVARFINSLAIYKPKEIENGLVYVTLEALTSLISSVTGMFAESSGQKQQIAKITVHPDARYNTFPEHISGNPTVGMLPKKTPAVNALLQDVYDYGDLAQALAEPSGSDQGAGDLGKIWVNIQHILLVLDSALDEDKNLDVLKFYKLLLLDLDKALGYVTELDLAYEEEYDTYYVVDRRFTQLQSGELYKLPVTGLGSTVTNISLTSKLSPRLGSMIAITAQASAEVSDVGIEAENMFKWNRGLTDRIIPEKTVTGSTSAANQHDTALVNFAKVLREFKETNLAEPSAFESVATSHRLITQTDFRKFLQSKNGKKDAVGIIPFELNITMDGIGGLKIGQAFLLGGRILPAKYRTEVAFLITGLEHAIDGNRWKTTIKAQTINNPLA